MSNVLNASYRLNAARVNEAKFFREFEKNAKRSRLVERTGIYERGRGLVLGVTLVEGTTIQQFLNSLGWKQTPAGTYLRNGEWPLFVGQAGPRSFAIQLESGTDDQSMERVARLISEVLPDFASKVYGADAVFVARPKLFDLAHILDDVRDFFKTYGFKGRGVNYTSPKDNLDAIINIKTDDKGPVVTLNVSFSK